MLKSVKVQELRTKWSDMALSFMEAAQADEDPVSAAAQRGRGEALLKCSVELERANNEN